MGLFRKKKEEAVPDPELPMVSDDATWRAWADKGNEFFDGGDFVKAVTLWCGAIDRYDDKPKYYEKFHEETYERISRLMWQTVVDGKVFPAHFFAELDAEAFIKIPDIRGSLFSEDLFYYAKEHLSDSDGPEVSAMLYISGAYAIAGYLRFSPDIRESADKCREVARLGRQAADDCKGFKHKGYNGKLKPKYGNSFSLTIVNFFDVLGEELQKAADGLTEEQYQALTEYRRSHMEDRLDHLAAALQLAIHSTSGGHTTKVRTEKGLGAEIDAYVADFLRMDEAKE